MSPKGASSPQLQAVPTTGAGLQVEWAQRGSLEHRRIGRRTNVFQCCPWLKQMLWTDIALSGYQAHLKGRTHATLKIALATGSVGGACFSTPALEKLGS